MGAAHIVRHDLQLGLGVHPGPIRQQQVAAQLGGVGALSIAGNTDGAVKNRVGLAAGQAFLQLIQLPLRPVEAHRGVGGQLLLGAGDGQTFKHGLCLAIHLHHPGLHPSQIPALNHRSEGIGAAGLLLDSQMGHQR